MQVVLVLKENTKIKLFIFVFLLSIVCLLDKYFMWSLCKFQVIKFSHNFVKGIGISTIQDEFLLK
jgi:hypothetical protein